MPFTDPQVSAVICQNYLKQYKTNHICGRERDVWNVARRFDHRCACDMCYAAHLKGHTA